MILFKLLISSFILSAELSAQPDADGWVAIERPEKIAPAEGADERDPSIWVIFSKQIGPEKILVSFPSEPSYRYMGPEGDQMEVYAASKGVEHRLQVIEQVVLSSSELLTLREEQLKGVALFADSHDPASKTADLTYWKDGFWFQERLIATDRYTYFLQTKGSEVDGDVHHTFIQSFDLDFDRNMEK